MEILWVDHLLHRLLIIVISGQGTSHCFERRHILCCSKGNLSITFGSQSFLLNPLIYFLAKALIGLLLLGYITIWKYLKNQLSLHVIIIVSAFTRGGLRLHHQWNWLCLRKGHPMLGGPVWVYSRFSHWSLSTLCCRRPWVQWEVLGLSRTWIPAFTAYFQVETKWHRQKGSNFRLILRKYSNGAKPT